MRQALVAAVSLTVVGVSAQAPAPRPEDVDAIARVSEYVQQYLAVARTIVARELVTLQPLDRNLRPEGRARILLYETRTVWDPGTVTSEGTATVNRQLLTVDGHAPAPEDNAGCMAAASDEPLAFLLPARRKEFTFSKPVPVTVGGQPTLTIEYAPNTSGTPSLEWTGDCGRLMIPGRVKGRVVLDPQTYTVMRVEQELVDSVVIPVDKSVRREGWGDRITVDRVDVTMVFKRMSFRNPDETLILPSEIRRLTVVRTPAARRLAVTQQWIDYQRFVTGGRVVPVQ